MACESCVIGVYDNPRQEVTFRLFAEGNGVELTDESMNDLLQWLPIQGGEVTVFDSCPDCGRQFVPEEKWFFGPCLVL